MRGLKRFGLIVLAKITTAMKNTMMIARMVMPSHLINLYIKIPCKYKIKIPTASRRGIFISFIDRLREVNSRKRRLKGGGGPPPFQTHAPTKPRETPGVFFSV